MIDGLRPYPEYKDTRLAWLDRIPTGWNCLRAKSVFKVIDVRSRTGHEELLTVSAANGVIPRVQATVTMFKAKSYVGHKLCWPGDLVVNSLWAWMQGLGFSQRHGLISSAYSVYRPWPEYASFYRFFHYLLRSAAYKWELQTRSKGVWLSRLQLLDSAFMDMPVLLPPAEDADAIVCFLNYAHGKVEQLIRAKKKLIELLDEQKQAIVHRAVTRGLDATVPVKPSGIPWLSHIPKHWEVAALRRYWRVTDCKHLTVPFVDEGIPLASVVEVQTFTLNLSRCKKTRPEWYRLLIEGGRKPTRGDLIYCRNASVGACALVDTDIDFAMGQDVCLIRSEAQNQRFLNYLLHSPFIKHQLELLLVGSTFKRINISEIKALTVVVPPKKEQDEICGFLDSELATYDIAINCAEREIKLLREYRTRLVADVVTGKLDVRGVTRYQPAEAEELSASFESEDSADEGELELVVEGD